ncbi:hypothetical protein, partial [Flavobacterium subsaxonicum]
IASSCLLAMTVTGTVHSTLHTPSLRGGTTKQSVQQLRSIKGKFTATLVSVQIGGIGCNFASGIKTIFAFKNL